MYDADRPDDEPVSLTRRLDCHLLVRPLHRTTLFTCNYDILHLFSESKPTFIKQVRRIPGPSRFWYFVAVIFTCN